MYCCFAIFKFPYHISPVLFYGQCQHWNILITDHRNMTLQRTFFLFNENLLKFYSIVIVHVYVTN